MAKLTNQAEIQQGYIPADEETMPSSKGRVSDRGMHVPDLDLIDAKNTLPTNQGYISYFGITDTLEDVGNQLDEDVQNIITYKTLHGDTIQIAFCANGLYMRSVAGDAVGTLTNVPAAGSNPEYDKLDLNDKKCKWTQVLTTIPTSPWKMWTYCLMENALFVFQKGMDYIGRITSYEPEQIIFEHRPPTYLLQDFKRHKFTYTSEDDSTGDDTYKSITITTDTGLNFGVQKIAVDSASDVSLAIEAWKTAFHTTGFFSTEFRETLRTEVSIDAFIPIVNQGSLAALQTIIDNTAHNGDDTELSLTPVWGSAAYDSILYDVSGQAITPSGVAFNSDGTKMYVVDTDYGTGGDTRIYQYTLSTAYNISTATYDTLFFDYINEEANFAVGIQFNPTGTKMYLLGGTSTDRIYQYTLSTAWNISTATYDTVFLNVQGGAPSGMAFTSDGTKIYHVDYQTDLVYQYNLTIAWDLSTASYATKSLDVSPQCALPSDVEISDDGATLYVLGSVDSIYQYTLSTPFDLSTATYTSLYLDTSPPISIPATPADPSSGMGLTFVDSAIKFYVVDWNAATIYSYTSSKQGIEVGGFKKEFPTVIGYGANATYLTPHDDSNTLAIALRALYLADPTIGASVGILTITQAATCDLHYNFDVYFTLIDQVAIPSSVEAQDGTSVFTEDSTSSAIIPMGQIEGIMSGRSRLGAWDEDNIIYWSSAKNLVDFIPSAETGANQITVRSLKGNITKCEGFTNGFVIYGTGNVVVATFANSITSVYNFKPIEESEGLIDYRHLASQKDIHYYWSSKGLVTINPETHRSDFIAPELTDWIKKYRYPIQIHMIANRFLVLYIQDRDDVFSNRSVRNGGPVKKAIRRHPSLTPVEFTYISPGANLYPTFTRALVYDTQLQKWGSCDVACKLLVSLTPYNQSGYQLAKNYQLLDAALDNEQREIVVRTADGYTRLATTFPSDSYVLFGHYSTHRDKTTKLVEIDTEYVNYPDATLEIEKSIDGAKVDFTQNVSYTQDTLAKTQGINMAARWFNILVKGGHYHLKRLLTKGYTYGR